VNSSLVLVFFFIFFYLISCTSYCIFIASFFSKAKRAALIGFIIFFSGMIIPAMIPDGKAYKVIVSLCHPGSLFMYTVDNFIFYESNQIGVTADTARTAIDIYSIPYNECLVIMVVDTFMYICLSWYVAKVVPSDFGVSLPPHFIFMPSYWKTGEVWSSNKGDYATVDTNDIQISTVEEVRADLVRQEEDKEIIQIKGLRKVYNTNSGEKVAVSGLDLNFYKGQVSCLLGHNGAGKTTTINVLNGMTTPTSGSVKIGPHDVSTEMNIIRRNLGVCPQHDVLFLTMTVEQHLRLFAAIKQVKTDNLSGLITNILEEVGIPEKVRMGTKKCKSIAKLTIIKPTKRACCSETG
jgi:ABC-type multidrug transport system fused ATPase/permease subunit